MSVTANVSAPSSTNVVCNDCWNGSKHGAGRRSWGWAQLHCSTCHANDDHWACEGCGECLPRSSRLDRLYCSSACRSRGHKQREREALERAAWEAANPVRAAELKAEEDALIAKLRETQIAIEGGAERLDAKKAAVARRRKLKATADRCAQCDRPITADDVIYRRRYRGLLISDITNRAVPDISLPVLPYCAEHRCGQPDGHHNRDAGDGYYYRGCRCDDRRWMSPEPCLGCGRLISDPRGATWRFSRDWRYHGEDGPPAQPRVFCGSECKRLVLAVETKSSRLAAAAKRETVRCEACGETFTPTRSDARYCSSACRQDAYRRRKAARR